MRLTRHGRNIVSLLAGDFANRLIGFAAATFLARQLSTDGFGVISIGMAVLTYATIIGDAGLSFLGTRSVAADGRDDPLLTTRLLTARLLLSLIVILLIGASIYFLQLGGEVASVIMVYSIYAIPSALLLEWYFRARQWIGEMFAARFAGAVAYLLIVLIWVGGRSDTVVPAIGWTAGGVINVLVLFIIFFRRGSGLQRIRGASRLPSLIRKAFPLGAASLLAQVILQFPILFLGWRAGASAAGLFSAAFKIALLMLIVDRIFYNIFFPLVSKTATQSPGALEEIVQRMLRIVAFSSLSSAIIAVVAAEQVVVAVFGEAFRPAATTFRLMMCYVVLTLNASVYTYTLIALNRERDYTRSLLLGTAAFILFLALHPQRELAESMAIVLGVFEFVVVLAMSHSLYKQIGIHGLRQWLVPVIFSLAALAAAILSGAGTLPLSLLGLGLIPLLALMTGLRTSDLAFLRRRLL